ncbi:hypothetical protein [Cryptosporangium arvum]|nr:hypothetical protein [Cryptosporangium arvum]
MFGRSRCSGGAGLEVASAVAFDVPALAVGVPGLAFGMTALVFGVPGP